MAYYYLSSTPTDMRKGREGLAGVVREKMQRDPYTYGDAFIFYSKDLKKVRILHYDINGGASEGMIDFIHEETALNKALMS